MINFFILNGDQKRTCTATDISKATQILSLMFPTHKGYVIEDNKVVFAHNMTPDEAEIAAGLKLQSMTLLPLALCEGYCGTPMAALVKPKKAKAKKKPVKVVTKKTKLKSKVVVKNKKKSPAKKTVVKSKVKPKTKAKAKGKKR